jgi:hypothetical protein
MHPDSSTFLSPVKGVGQLAQLSSGPPSLAMAATLVAAAATTLVGGPQKAFATLGEASDGRR